MSLARARARKLKKQANKGDKLAKRSAIRASLNVEMSYAKRYRLEQIYRKEVLENLWLIYRYTMHVKYGFGKNRLNRLRDKTWNEFESIMSGFVSVPEIDRFLKSDIEFDCGLCTRDPKADRVKQIEDKAIRDLTAAFVMALLDEFGYKGKKLEKICHAAFEINDAIMNGTLTYTEIRQALAKTMERGRKNADKKIKHAEAESTLQADTACA